MVLTNRIFLLVALLLLSPMVDFFLGGLGPCKGPKSLGTLGKEKREKKGEGRILLSVQNSSTVTDSASDIVMNRHQSVKKKQSISKLIDCINCF